MQSSPNVYSMEDRKILSLDIETTGLDHKKHSILSIGCVNESLRLHYSIRYSQKQLETLEYTQKALDVNHIRLEQLSDPRRMFMHEAIENLESKLIHDNYLLVGLNVGTFDYRFLEPVLQDSILLYKFGYHFFDINTAMFQICELYNFSFNELKRDFKSIAYSKMRKKNVRIYNRGEHDALFDAYMCYDIYKMLTNGDFLNAYFKSKNTRK